VLMVVDASAAVELLLATGRGRRIGERVAAPELSLHAPHLIDLEVAQAIRRYAAAGSIDAERGRMALHFLGLLGIERYGHADLLDRIWALRHNLTAYDAAYVALAEALAAPLLTCDRALAEAPGHAATIELVS
jgi:predicted nucleic acid-binding protein